MAERSRERNQALKDLFDHKHPEVTALTDRYRGRTVDYSDERGMTGRDIADAILSCPPSKLLILPDRDYWDRGLAYRHRQTGIEILYDTPARFRKFADSVDIVKSNARLRDIREQQLTPREAFMELGTDENRERLLAGNVRGIGWWSPRARRHNIVWFDVPAEGQKYGEFLKKEFSVDYLFSDAYMEVPSFSNIDEGYITPLRVLPVTARGGECFIEWLETIAQCDCKDAFFMGASSKKYEARHDEFEALYRYTNPEQAVCRHNWAQRRLVYRASRERGEKPLQFDLPGARGLLGFWHVAKTRTLIRKGKKGHRRPLKTEIGIWCGHAIGYAGPEAMFDLSETITEQPASSE